MLSSIEMVSGCLVLQGGPNSMWTCCDVTIYTQTFCCRFFYDDLVTQHILSNTQIIKLPLCMWLCITVYISDSNFLKLHLWRNLYGVLNILCHCYLHYLNHYCRRMTSHLKHFMLKQFLCAGRYCCTKSFQHFLYKEYSLSADDII